MSTIAVTAALGLFAFSLNGAAASPDTYEAANVPGVHASLDCAAGRGYIQVRNADMSGSTIEMTIDGVRQPDLFVDSSGHLHQWYALAPNQPHHMSIIYDFVPGGSREEEDQLITVSCLDGAPMAATTNVPTTEGPGTHLVGTGFHPVSPIRVWDSRFGPGTMGRVGAGETREVSVTGVEGVPPSGVSSVVLNLTAVEPTAATHVTAWPTGEPMPLASNLNVPPGDVRPNLVIVKVGVDGKVSFNNAAGAVDLIADLAGYHGGHGA